MGWWGWGEGPAEVRPDPHAACLQVRTEHGTDRVSFSYLLLDKPFFLNLMVCTKIEVPEHTHTHTCVFE